MFCMPRMACDAPAPARLLPCRLPVDSARKLRWYDKGDVAPIVKQHVREKHLLLDTITALKKVKACGTGCRPGAPTLAPERGWRLSWAWRLCTHMHGLCRWGLRHRPPASTLTPRQPPSTMPPPAALLLQRRS